MIDDRRRRVCFSANLYILLSFLRDTNTRRTNYNTLSCSEISTINLGPHIYNNVRYYYMFVSAVSLIQFRHNSVLIRTSPDRRTIVIDL